MRASATTSTALVIFMVTSATSPRAETNTPTTSIYVAGALVEGGVFATSYTPTTTAHVTGAVDLFEEVSKPFPSTSDTLGSGITTSQIGHLLAGVESAAMYHL